MYVRSDVAFRGQTGLAMLNLSFVNPDPERRFAEGDGHVNERRRAVIRMSCAISSYLLRLEPGPRLEYYLGKRLSFHGIRVQTH